MTEKTKCTTGSKPLKNVRQETFAQLLAAGNMSQKDCYIKAGYCEKGAQYHASWLVTNGKVNQRIGYLRTQTAEKHEWTRGRYLTECQENLKMARDKNDISSANGSLLLIGKCCGLLTDVTRDDTGQTALSEERRRELAEAARRAAGAPPVVKLRRETDGGNGDGDSGDGPYKSDPRLGIRGRTSVV